MILISVTYGHCKTKIMVQKNKFVHKEVVFSHSIGNPWKGDVDLSKIKCVQKIKPTGRGMVLPVLRYPIIVNGEYWDIVQILLMFIMESIVNPDVGTKEEYLQKNLMLYNHVKECMTNHTTYFLPTMITVKEDKTNVENKELTIVAAMIVRKRATMTGQEKQER